MIADTVIIVIQNSVWIMVAFIVSYLDSDVGTHFLANKVY